ncbi:MAG: 3-dehydroquinate synthase [Actinobacteria bacterium]|nr:3-dehydroquinate synthase [Actinomycetota bacterium]
MRLVSVQAERAYEVVINCQWREEFLELSESRARVAVVMSAAMVDFIGELPGIDADLHIFTIPDSEAGKSVETLNNLWTWLGAVGFTRSDLIIGIGGGAATDIAGFAAATWLRGVDWVAIPTTLAGMVDAAIGGKTGMNSGYGKNLIGSFHSPIRVVVDTSWLSSLSDRDFAAGLAEVIKCGFISEPRILELLEDKHLDEIRNDGPLVEELISLAVSIKSKVVGVDFKDNFAREVLNYGHTLGHAVELHSHFDLRHGEAVAIGMIFVAELARLQGILSQDIVDLHRNILVRLGLPVSYSRDAWDALYRNLAMDKKTRGNSIRFVALSGIGQTLRLENLAEPELRAAYERISS